MPKCIREEYTGNKSKHFSTQIGYSNYPRLFNLATRLRALFQVPSTIAEIASESLGRVKEGVGGGGGNLSRRYIIPCMMSGRKSTASVCRRGTGDYEFGFDPLSRNNSSACD